MSSSEKKRDVRAPESVRESVERRERQVEVGLKQ